MKRERGQPIVLEELDAANVRAADGDIAKIQLAKLQVIAQLNQEQQRAEEAKGALWAGLEKRYPGLQQGVAYTLKAGTLYPPGTEPKA